MESVKLKVSSKVIAQSKKDVNQEQIAITKIPGSLSTIIANAKKSNRVTIKIAGVLNLEVGDTSAIWKAHNSNYNQEFESLFEFLSKYPDKEFEFICTVS